MFFAIVSAPFLEHSSYLVCSFHREKYLLRVRTKKSAIRHIKDLIKGRYRDPKIKRVLAISHNCKDEEYFFVDLWEIDVPKTWKLLRIDDLLTQRSKALNQMKL